MRKVANLVCLSALSLVGLATCSKPSASRDAGATSVPPPSAPAGGATSAASDAKSTTQVGLCKDAVGCGSACRAGRPDACLREGLFIEEGAGASGSASFKSGCRLGEPMSCVMVAVGRTGSKQDQTGGAAHDASALDALEQGCKDGKGRSCWGLALVNGLGPFVDLRDSKPDLSVAKGYATKACDSGYGLACEVLAESLEKKDPKAAGSLYRRAGDLFERTCLSQEDDYFSGSCDRASMLFERGLGGKKDPERLERLRARKLDLILEEACKHGVAPACSGDRSVLGDVVFGKYTTAEMVTFWPIRACDVGILDSCWPEPWDEAAWDEAARMFPPPRPPPPPPRRRIPSSSANGMEGGVEGGVIGGVMPPSKTP